MADGSVVILIEGDDSKFKGTLGKLGGVAKAALGGVTAGLGALAGYAVKVGSDFEAAMSNVAAISGAAGEDMAALTEKAKEMGAKTKFSATESADALSYMAMAGWKTEDMLGGLEGIMNLAAASGEDLASTSDIVTDALTAFGMQANESGRFADVLAAASSNSNTNVALMGETFKYVAPVAGALGYSVEDTAVAIGLMANAGIKGSQAGTALRGVLTNLAKPSKRVAKYIEELGLSLTDSAGNVRPMNELLQQLREKFLGLTKAQKLEYAAGVAGKEAMSGLLAIVNASNADFQKLTNAIQDSNGAAEEMAEIMNDNLKGAVTIAKSGLEGLGITIYESLENPLKVGVQSALGAIQKLQNSLNSGQMKSAMKTLGKGLGDAVSGLARFAADAIPKAITGVAILVQNLDKIGVAVKTAVAAFVTFKAASAIGSLITIYQKAALQVALFTAGQTAAAIQSGIATGALKAHEVVVGVLTGKITLLTAAQGALKAVMSANPYVLAAIAVGTVVAAIGAYQVATQDAASESQKWHTRIQEVKDALEEQAEAQEQLANTRADGVSSVLTEVGAVEDYVEELRNLIDANGRVKQGYEMRAQYLSDQINHLIPNAIAVNRDEKGSIYDIADAIEEKIFALKKEMALEAMREEYMTALQQQKEAEKNVTAALQAQGDAQEQLANAQEKLNQARTPVELARYGEQVAQAKRKLEEATDAVHKARAAAEGYQHTISTFDATVAAKSMEELEGVLANLSANIVRNTGDNRVELEKAVADLQLTYDRLVRESEDAWSTATDDQKKQWQRILDETKDALDKQVAEAISGGVEIGEGLVEGTAESGYQYPKEIQSIMEKGQKELHAAGVNVYQGGGELAKKLASGISDNQGNPVAAAVAVAVAAADAAATVQNRFETIGKAMMDGLAAGIRNNMGSAGGGGPVGTAFKVALAAAAAARKASEVQSPSKVFRKIGGYFSEGMAIGIAGGTKQVTDASTKVAATAIEATKEALDIHSPSGETMAIGILVAQGLAIGIRRGKQLVLSAQEEVCTALIRVAETGVQSLNQRIAKIQEAAQERQAKKEREDHEKSIQEKYKALEKLELEQQEKLAKAKKDERAKLEQEYLEDRDKLKNDIAKLDADWSEKQLKAQEQAQQESLKSSISAIEDIQKEYESARDDILRDAETMAGKLSDYGDLYTIDSKTGKLNLEDLQKSLQAVQQYKQAILDLKDKGASAGFLEEIASLGVEEGLKFAQALSDLSEEELSAYMGAWEQIQQESRNAADAFYADQLSALDESFTSKLDEQLQAVPPTMKNLGQEFVQGMIDGMESKSNFLAAAAAGVVRMAVSAMRKEADVNSPSKKTRDLVGKPMGEGVGMGFQKALPLAMEQARAAVERETTRLSVAAAARANAGSVQNTAPEVRTYYQRERLESTPIVRFEGELSALGKLLYPHIEVERKRRGGNLVKGGVPE